MQDIIGSVLIIYGVCSLILLIISVCKFLIIKIKIQDFISQTYATKSKKRIKVYRENIMKSYITDNSNIKNAYMFSKLIRVLFFIIFFIALLLFLMKTNTILLLLAESFLFLFLAIYCMSLKKIALVIGSIEVPTTISYGNNTYDQFSTSLLLINKYALRSIKICTISLFMMTAFLSLFCIFSSYI